MPKEYIIYAAIWWQNGKTYVHQPLNVDTGLVISGRRHANCIAILSLLKGNKTEYIQGFMTSSNLFVDRIDGLDIAIKAGQTNKTEGQLYSEDLY